jgi:hypothetical protein
VWALKSVCLSLLLVQSRPSGYGDQKTLWVAQQNPQADFHLSHKARARGDLLRNQISKKQFRAKAEILDLYGQYLPR